MCGFVGWFQINGAPADKETLVRMRDMIKYRGPDDAGAFLDEHAGLGHVRLSILDLSSLAAQPMHSKSGRYVFAYNGEVYNFGPLREQLKARNIPLRSTGDTETLIEYIAEFGMEKCLAAIEGMFAFAVWDRQEKTMTIARDRHGIKPLYYAVKDGRIAFSSEMKVLLDMSPGPDPTSVNAAMLGLGCAYDSHTLLQGIHSVRAGEYIVFRMDQPPVKKFFFRLPDFIDPERAQRNEQFTPEQAVNEVHEALKESMRLCMISDAPLAVLASGGIDSSLIAGIANKAHPNLKLYHANVEGASETSAAEALSRHLKCELFSAKVTPQDTLDYTPIVTYHYEMPLMYHTNAVPFYLVSKLASSHGIKVVLTGEGSDEYFIGYARMAIWPLIQKYRRMMARAQDLVHKLPGLGGILWPRSSDNMSEHLRNTMFRYELEERRGEAAEKYSFIKNADERLLQIMSLDMCVGNIPPLLHRNDRLGMAWGIESRFPFLGHAVASLALNLPARFKVRKGLSFYDKRHPYVVDKWAVRQVAEQYLSRELARRGKYAFRAVAYDRLNLKRDFFLNGFVSDFYGLSPKAIDLMLANSNAAWRTRVFLLENWGRIFARREQPDAIREHIRKHVSYAA